MQPCQPEVSKIQLQTSKRQPLPVKTLRKLIGVQVTLRVLNIIVCIVTLALVSDRSKYSYDERIAIQLCHIATLIASIIALILGPCIFGSSLKNLRHGILCNSACEVILIGPTIIGLNILFSITGQIEDELLVFSIIIAAFAFIDFIISIGLILYCTCTKWHINDKKMNDQMDTRRDNVENFNNDCKALREQEHVFTSNVQYNTRNDEQVFMNALRHEETDDGQSYFPVAGTRGTNVRDPAVHLESKDPRNVLPCDETLAVPPYTSFMTTKGMNYRHPTVSSVQSKGFTQYEGQRVLVAKTSTQNPQLVLIAKGRDTYQEQLMIVPATWKNAYSQYCSPQSQKKRCHKKTPTMTRAL